MAKSKHSNTEFGQPAMEQANSSTRITDNSDLDRRLAALEKSVAELNKSHIDILKWTIATVFPVIAILLAALGILTRYDASQAIKDAQSKIAALVGEALKKPILELLHEGTVLENQLVDLFHDGPDGVTPYEVSLSTLLLKNTGNRRTEPLSVYIFSTVPLRLAYGQQEWEQAVSDKKEYASSFISTRHTTVAPEETLNIHPLVFDWTNIDRQTNVQCTIQVYYGGEKTAEARFRVRLKQR